MNRLHVVRLNDPRLRWPRRLFVAASIALTLFTVTGFFVMPPLLRHLAESQLSERLDRKVTIEKVRVNPFALSVTVEGFQMLEADGLTPFVTFRRLYVNCELASIYRRAPVLREVRIESPRVWVVRRRATPDAWAAREAYNFSDIVTRLLAASVVREPPAAQESPPPQFSINNIEIIDGAAVFDDRPLGIRHEITALSLGVPFISTLPINVDTFVQPRLGLLVDGTPFGIQGRTKPFQDSLQTIVELRLNELDLTRYLPYVPLPLAFVVTSARLTVALDVSFVRPRSGTPMLSVRGQVALRDVALRAPGASGRPLVGLDELAVRIGAADLPARRMVLEDVLISGLDVHARRLADGSLDLEHLSPLHQPVPRPASRTAGRATTPAARSAVDQPARLSISEIRVEKTALHLRDESVRPPFEETIDHVTASIRRLSTAPGAEATEEVSLRATPGVTLKQKGTLTVDPFAAAGTFSIDGIEPALLAAYYRDGITFDVAKGRVRAGTNYRIQDRGDHHSVRLRDAFVEVADLALRWRARKGEIARIPELAVRGIDLDLDGHAISVADVQSRDGSLRMLRDEKGLVDLTAMMVPPAPATSAAPAGPDWTLALARLDVQGWDVRYEDRAVDPPVVLGARRVSLQASNFSTAHGAAANVELGLALPNKGRLAMAGSVSLRPVSAKFRFDLRALDVVPLQKYWQDQVSFVVTRGTVSAKGQARFQLPEAPPGRSAPEPSFSLAGDIDVTDFASVDAAKKEALLRWQSFHVGGLKLSTAPLALRIRQVALSDFDARLVIFPDAHFNLEDILAGQARSKSVPAAVRVPSVRPPPKIAVDDVTFQRGKVVFTDRKIQPRTSATLTELGGRLTGLSSDVATQADVEIRGTLDHTSLLGITGRINPLARDLFVEMKAEVKDLDLPPASPYSAKYIGYGIRKGKLSLALDYHIASRKLYATNHVVLDQLSFGDKVQSPDAVNWPVKLAVALLQDRHGVIDVDLPIAGSLDDLDFKVGRLIWKALGNLVIKAATAPFSLIPKACGGGDELSYLEFPPGLAALDSKALEKLKPLAKALQARPGLSFEIQGGSDPERDREGLRRDLFERKLEAQKLAEVVREGVAVSAAGVRFDPTERPRLLAKAYRAETFPKPRNVLGFAKSLAPEEMGRLILANIRVENEDLRALALRRASAVKEALARLAPAETARLFLVNPRIGSGATRVDFKLKVD